MTKTGTFRTTDFDEKNKSEHEPQNKSHVTCTLILTVVGAILGSFQFGYGLGVVNNTEKSIKEFMNETHVERTGEALSDDVIKNLWSLAVSIYSVGGCIGGFLGGWVAKKVGRKRGMIYNSVYGIVCAALLFSCRRGATYELLIVARFLDGIKAGIYSAISPLYLSEISATHMRGALGVLHQLAVVTGLLVSQVLGFNVILGGRDLWDVVLGLSIIPCLAQIGILAFCPDSPRFLMISCDDEVASQQALVSLRGCTDVREEIDEMKREKMTQEKKVSIAQLFVRPSLRMPLLIGIIMQCSQQLGGINGVFFYSTSLFEDTGLSQTTATYTTSATGGIMVVMTLVTVPLMDRAGRRTLHLVGLGGMFVVGILVTIALNLRREVEAFKYVAVVVTLFYVVFFAIGPGSIPWLIVSELFSHESRPAAMSVCVLVNWLFSFVVGYGFPFVQEGLGDYTFVPFTILVLLFFIFTFFKVPETKGKTFEEVTSLWRGQSSSYDDTEKNGVWINDSNGASQNGTDINYGSTDKAFESETTNQ